jgi:Mg/Co/Ni transporter MgtE
MVADVMATEVVSFQPEDEARDAAQAFERYDLVSPVVDERGALIGRLTVDEMVDVMREESDSEVLNGGSEGRGRPVCARSSTRSKTAGPGWPSICALLSLHG